MAHFMVELLVRGVVLCLLAVMILALFRRSAAAYRHLVCVVALCGLLILPFAQWLMPPLPPCDDRGLLSGVAGTDYAAHLLEIARSICTNEVAPAMAHGGGMEERMRHLLDDTKPRKAQTRWLVISAPFVLALLSFAVLRVSARSAEMKPQTNKGAATLKPAISPSQQLKSADPTHTDRVNGTQGSASPAATLDRGNDPMQLENITWGKAVEGLEPGLLPALFGFPGSRRVPLNSYISYRALVRNTTGRELVFELQCTRYGPSNAASYVIPNADAREALRSHTIPERFRATGISDDAEVSPAYYVKLAPGETVVVPEEFGLYIGDADKQRFPRMAAVQTGMNWIVQPILVHLLTAAEKLQFERMILAPNSSQRAMKTVDRAGKTVQKSFPMIGAQTKGKPLFAGTQLEVRQNWDRTLTANSPVNAATFSPDSKHLLTGSVNGTGTVWDVTTGRIRFALKGNTAAITCTRYTLDGKFILTGYSDGAIHIWDAATGEKLRTLTEPGGGVCALDSADGATIVGGYENGQVKIWNTTTGQDVGAFAYDNRLLTTAISPDGKTVAAGYFDSTLKVWDIRTRQTLISEKITRSQGFTGLHLDTQGYLYTWDREEIEDPEETHHGTIKITALTVWGVRPRRILSKITFAEPPGAIRHVVSYNNLAMLFGLSEGRIVLNNMQDGPVTLEAHDGTVAAVAISPDGTLGATCSKRSGKGEARIWDMQAHKPAITAN